MRCFYGEKTAYGTRSRENSSEREQIAKIVIGQEELHRMFLFIWRRRP
jgi:hypothetical protein